VTRSTDLNVVLTGFMGTGKTTVGRLIAHELGWTFVDTDEVIEERHGPIPQIFIEGSEVGFRILEREVAAEFAEQTQQVIATGGRMLLDPNNARVLQKTGRVYCLAASAAEIARRLRPDLQVRPRPLLAGNDISEQVTRLLAERAVGYSRFEQVPTDGREPEDIAADIVRRLEA
jgi:shikimate kinase